MSLHAHLRSRSSPVRAWFEESFPATRAVAMEANRSLRGGDHRTACPVPPPRGSDCSLVGMAVDYLVRVHLRPDALDRTVAQTGAQMLDHRLRGERAARVEREAVRRIAQAEPWRRLLDDDEWPEMCAACAGLARLEQWYRAGPAVLGYTVDPLRHVEGLDDFVSTTVGEASLADLAHLGRIAVEDHLDLRRCRTLALNPRFRESLALGGADADLVCDGLLLEWKATATGSVVGREELWQLLGYVLADGDDAHRLRSVGISAVRWRRRASWSIEELVSELGTAARPLDRWRSEFAALVREAAVQDLPATLQRLASRSASESPARGGPRGGAG